MAVSIYYKKKFWSAGNSLGYLIINTTAEHITDPSIRKHLQEIDEFNLGILSFDDMTEPEKVLIRKTIQTKVIPQLKAAHPSGDILKLLDELAAILSQ